MNILQQFASAFESEQAKLRKLHARGETLPYRGKPDWLLKQRPTTLGFYRLPLASLTEGMVNSHSHPLRYLILLLPAAAFLAIQFILVGETTTFGTSGMIPGLLGILLILVSLFVWNDYAIVMQLAPETVSMQLHPGETFLLLVKRLQGTCKFRSARLIYRERWFINDGNNSRWQQSEELSIPLDFVKSAPGLLTAHVELPDDLPSSYDAGIYRLEWSIAIESIPWWGFARTCYYILWIAP